VRSRPSVTLWIVSATQSGIGHMTG